MAIYDGFVSIGDEDVHVILGVDDDKVTLSSGGNEIGAWPVDEVEVDHMGGGVYRITAESESLRFVPSDPSLFALGFGSEDAAVTEMEAAPNDARAVETGGTTPHQSLPNAGSREAPPPRPVTKVLFYALAGVTGVLGLWALVSMILG